MTVGIKTGRASYIHRWFDQPKGRENVMAEEPYNPSPVGNPSVLARRNWLQTKLVIFIGKHTPKCREMVRILSQSMDQPMPLIMRIR